MKKKAMKTLPKKYSFLKMRIEAANFNPEDIRKKFVEALWKNFPECHKEEKLYVAATKDYESFKAFCRAAFKEIKDADYYRTYIEFPFMGTASCCGVHELSFCDFETSGKANNPTKKVLLALLYGFADSYGKYYYLKYFDNGAVTNFDDVDDYEDEWGNTRIDGPEVFKVLKNLGWKCTGRFINPNHSWPNYEMSANYGEDTR